MSKNISAFPLALDGLKIQNGMSIRDWCAIEVLKNIVGNMSAVKEINRGHEDKHPTQNFAEWAYKMADEMLKAREVDVTNGV